MTLRPLSAPGGALLLAGALLALAPRSVRPQEAVRDTVLQNGLHVIVLPNPSIPVATLEVVLRAGAFTQFDSRDEGAPHILEHLLFRSYDGGAGFGGAAADLGATYNGTTGPEAVTYYLTLPSDQVEDGLDRLSNLVRNPEFDRRVLADEIPVVRGEPERGVSDPQSLLELVTEQALWGPSFQRKNAIGNMSTILSADAGRLLEFYRRFYVPNNAALVVSGDVDVDDVFSWAQNRFRRWNEGADPFQGLTVAPITPLARDTAFVVDVTSNDVTILVKWHGPSVTDDPVGSLAADVMARAFNLATSPAQRRLVDSGIFQSVSIGYQTLDNVGPIRLVARTTPDVVDRALEELGAELARLADPGYFDAVDLEAAKRSLRVDRAVAREAVATAAHTIGYFWAVGGIDFYRGYEDGLQDVTMDDVRAYLGRYVVNRPKVVAALVTSSTRSSLSPRFAGLVNAWPRAESAPSSGGSQP